MEFVRKPIVIIVYDTVHSDSWLPAEGSAQDDRLFWNIGRQREDQVMDNISDYNINNDYIVFLYLTQILSKRNILIV